MCSPSNVYQLISAWGDIAAVDGIGEGIRGGVSSFVGMCSNEIRLGAALTIVLCVVALGALRRVKLTRHD